MLTDDIAAALMGHQPRGVVSPHEADRVMMLDVFIGLRPRAPGGPQ
jgi:hypothetical protein